MDHSENMSGFKRDPFLNTHHAQLLPSPHTYPKTVQVYVWLHVCDVSGGRAGILVSEKHATTGF